MSSTSSPPNPRSKRRKGAAKATKPPTARRLSASEIARNLTHFEIWSSHQKCEQVSFSSDIPEVFKQSIQELFDFSSRPKLPAVWLEKGSPEFKSLSNLVPEDFLSFLQEIHDKNPKLFGKVANADVQAILSKMIIVHSAWRRLNIMKESKEKYSEADYAANVYNVLRSPAIRGSTLRVQCSISLPQPLVTANVSPETARILGAKTASPDAVVMIPSAKIRALSLSKDSPYQVLKRHPNVVKTGNVSKSSSFRFQSTPLVVPPETPAFQFVSSVWEDKKPVHTMLEDAYRQNRMSTAAAARHLHCHQVKAPVIGLVWASGTVRAHVDWCGTPSEGGKSSVVYSAPYRIESIAGDGADIFHEWQLDRAADIAEVFFLIENIDRWTMNGFRELVLKGVDNLVESVVKKEEDYVPWKRVGDLPSSSAPAKENANISASTASSTQPSPPRPIKTRVRNHK